MAVSARYSVLLLGSMVFAQSVCAAELASYPTRPIRIIVPQSPGASTDLTARMVGQKLSEAFKQPVVIENRPGSSGIAGTEAVARASPDGYTLMVVASSFSINPALGRKLPYDAIKDFTTVSQLARFPNMLAAHPSFPAKTLPEVIAAAKAKPGQISYASAGLATGTHMSAELLRYMTGIDLLHVPFRGGTPATTAAIAGEVQVLLAGGSSRPQVKAGYLRALASTGRKRASDFPDLPTINEFYPGYVVEIWLGIFASSATPQPIGATLQELINSVVARSDYATKLNASGLEPLILTTAGFAEMIQQDYVRYGKLTKEIGIKLD